MKIWMRRPGKKVNKDLETIDSGKPFTGRIIRLEKENPNMMAAEKDLVKDGRKDASEDVAKDAAKASIESPKNSGKFFERVLKWGLLSALVLIVVFGAAYLVMKIGFGKKFSPFDTTRSTLEMTAATGSISRIKVPTAPVLRDQENPVNGVMVTSAELATMKSRKLVVISLNNHNKARPQFGLSRADLVLEVLAEGGITRYNGYFYQDQTVKKVGPIRSARSYMLEFMMGYDDPVFVHEGQASYPPQERAVPEINTLRQISEWHIKSMQTAGSRYRDAERRKSAGYVHSLMTGFDLINKEIDRLGWRKPSDIAALKFKYDAIEEDRDDVKTIKVKFTGMATTLFTADFTYDPVTNTYLRSIGGVADVDALTGDRLAPKNVIVEYHDYRDAMDGHSRIIITMLGQGEVFVFRDGKMIKGTWKKAKRTDRTRYYDSAGNEIELNRGQIWVVNAIRTKTHKVTTMTVDGVKIP